MNKFGEITVQWLEINDHMKNNRNEEALKELNSLLGKLGHITLNGHPGNYKIDGITLDFWKERAWLFVEKLGALPQIDEDVFPTEEYEGLIN